MEAKTMFTEIGYTLFRADDDYIILKKTVEDDLTRVISFCSQLRRVFIGYESPHRVLDVPSIDAYLLLAIRQQFLELGWI